MNNSQRGEGLVSNILAIAGFIILIVIIIWGAFHFLNLASSGFSSLLNRAGASTIRVTAPRTASAGQPLDVSWQYTPSNTQGSYALLYQCKEGFQFRFPTASSTMAIPCGSPFAIGNPEAKTARLLPMLTGTQSADVALSIMYMTAGTSTPTTVAQGNASITIVSSTTTPATTGTGTTGGTGGTTGGTKTGTVTPVKPTTPVVTTPKPTTPSDLVVRILSVGVIDSRGMFVQRAPISQDEIVAVTFDIKNQGGTPTGVWYFSAQLPTNPATPYISPAQRSLGAGDHIENTLRFNQATAGGYFTVTVDPSNTVRESNESNNSASQTISWGNYGYPTYPQPYPYWY